MTDKVYVHRNPQGQIISVSLESDARHQEAVAPTDAEVVLFGQKLSGQNRAFLESDLALVRVLEDLIDVLIDKDVLQFTDLPQAAQDKLLSRQTMRRRDLDILDDDEDAVI